MGIDILKSEMTGIFKEQSGDKILITTITKSWFGLIHTERWFTFDSKEWTEIPDQELVTDLDLIYKLNGFRYKLPFTYSIR